MQVSAAMTIYTPKTCFHMHVGRGVVTIITIIVFKRQILVGIATVKGVVVHCTIEQAAVIGRVLECLWVCGIFWSKRIPQYCITVRLDP